MQPLVVEFQPSGEVVKQGVGKFSKRSGQVVLGGAREARPPPKSTCRFVFDNFPNTCLTTSPDGRYSTTRGRTTLPDSSPQPFDYFFTSSVPVACSRPERRKNTSRDVVARPPAPSIIPMKKESGDHGVKMPCVV